MKILKQVILFFVLFALFFGTNVLAVKRSSQFPKEVEQPLPTNVGTFPTPGSNSALGNVNMNAVPNNIINSEILPSPTEETTQKVVANNQTPKKSTPVSGQTISWIIFLSSLLIVFFAFVLLKFKKVL